MFFSGLIFGLLIGWLLCKLRNLWKSIDAGTMRMKEDAKATWEFWKERRKIQN